MSKKKTKNNQQKLNKEAVDLATSLRGQLLMGKLFYYGVDKMIEVEKEKPYFKQLKEKDKKNFMTSDVEDLKFIGENLYGSWIELAKFTEEFDDETIMKQLKKVENKKNNK